MKNIRVGRATKRVFVLLALLVCLIYLRNPRQAFASVSSCEQRCGEEGILCQSACGGDVGCIRVCEINAEECIKLCEE
jgi:hypothetical protein